MKQENHDLTTPNGLKNAAAYLANNILITHPLWWLVKGAYNLGSSFLDSSNEAVAAQAKAAVDIIKAGAENGADEITITMSQEAGAHFGGKVNGNPVKMTLGKSGTVTMTVKYKGTA